MWSRTAAAACLLLAGCRAQPSEPQFPAAHRDVAPTVSDTFSTEDARDRLGEAEQVMELAGIKHGMPPSSLKCEFAALGMQPVKAAMLAGREDYLMAFRLAGPKPAPDKIKACA